MRIATIKIVAQMIKSIIIRGLKIRELRLIIKVEWII